MKIKIKHRHSKNYKIIVNINRGTIDKELKRKRFKSYILYKKFNLYVIIIQKKKTYIFMYNLYVQGLVVNQI